MKKIEKYYFLSFKNIRTLKIGRNGAMGNSKSRVIYPKQ
jgi:hypothetical protein